MLQHNQHTAIVGGNICDIQFFGLRTLTLVSRSNGTVGGLPSPVGQPTGSGSTANGQEFLMKQGVPQLIAWPISANLTHHKAFLQRLQTSCLPHGKIKPILTMVPSLLNGLVGVSNEVEILFLDL